MHEDQDEARKDAIEDGAAAIFEAAIAAFPVIGGPVAVLVNRTMGSARMRRLETIVAKIREDLDAAIAEGKIGSSDLSTDGTLAALTRLLNSADETADPEHIEQMTKALIRGIELGWSREAFDYFDLARRLQPEQVAVLRKTAEAAEPSLKFAMRWESAERHWVDEDWTTPMIRERFSQRFQHLLNEGLVRTRDVRERVLSGHEVVKLEHALSYRGADFLHFLDGEAFEKQSWI